MTFHNLTAFLFRGQCFSIMIFNKSHMTFEVLLRTNLPTTIRREGEGRQLLLRAPSPLERSTGAAARLIQIQPRTRPSTTVYFWCHAGLWLPGRLSLVTLCSRFTLVSTDLQRDCLDFGCRHSFSAHYSTVYLRARRQEGAEWLTLSSCREVVWPVSSRCAVSDHLFEFVASLLPTAATIISH